MSILFQEIHEQPAAIERALASGLAPAKALVEEAKRRNVRMLILAARGTSDNAATYAKYLMQIVGGVPAALAAPSVHTLYEARVDTRDALVVGVSQSGAGEDVNEVVAQARKAGALTAAITNTPGSAISGIAEHVLFCEAGPEKAVAAPLVQVRSERVNEPEAGMPPRQAEFPAAATTMMPFSMASRISR